MHSNGRIRIAEQPNKSLHLIAISLRPKAAGELGRYKYLQHISKQFKPSKPLKPKLAIRKATVATSAMIGENLKPQKPLITRSNL